MNSRVGVAAKGTMQIKHVTYFVVSKELER